MRAAIITTAVLFASSAHARGGYGEGRGGGLAVLFWGFIGACWLLNKWFDSSDAKRHERLKKERLERERIKSLTKGRSK
jgi:hypothetical protein